MTKKVTEIARPKMLFIISNARSGSTMLRQLLNTHPNIVIPEKEFGEFKKVLLNFSNYQDLSDQKNFENFYKDAKNITTLNLGKTTDTKSGIYQIPKLEWYNKSESFKLEDLYRELLTFFANVSEPSKSNLLWVGDKSPQHIHYLKKLINSFPNAKFIFLTRNPIDISLSQDRFAFRHFNQTYGYDKITKAWKALHKKNNSVLNIRVSENIERLIKARNIFCKNEVDYYEVSYEDLLVDLKNSLKGIAQFLEISDEFDIDKFQIRKSSSGHKEGVNKVLTTNKLKYLSILNPKMIHDLENVFGDKINFATNKDFKGTYKPDISKNKIFFYKIQYFFNIVLTFTKVIGFKNTVSLVVDKFYLKKYKKSNQNETL